MENGHRVRLDDDGYLPLGGRVGVGVAVEVDFYAGFVGNQHHIRCRYQHDISMSLSLYMTYSQR